MFRKISTLVAVWLEKRVPYVETYVLLWYYLSQLFFTYIKVSDKSCRENQTTVYGQ